MRTHDPDTGQIQEQVTPEAVLDHLDTLDLPFITSKMIATEFDCSASTARNKLATLTERGDLSRIDLGQRRAVWCRADYEAATSVASALRQHFDLSDIDVDRIGAFAEKPYCLLPKADNEAYVVVPRFVPFHVGWLDRQTPSHNVFVVNKFVDWIDELPEDIRSQVGITTKYDSATVADGALDVTPSQRDEAWEEFATDRHQDAIPGDDRLAEMDWDKLRGLASRRGVLEHGMTREEVERALAAERDDDRIPLKQSREFDVIADLIDDGNLPFEPNPVDDTDLRSPPEQIDLRKYQTRAWERFTDTGMVGVYWPPSAGKTFLALYTGERVRGHKLVVVPNNTLKEQWHQRIEKFCDYPDEWEIQTYQYLTHYDNIDDYQSDGPTVTIFDENHHLPANTFAKLSTIDTDYRIGLSASPYREDERSVAADEDVLIRRDGEVQRREISAVYAEGAEELEALSFDDGDTAWLPVSAVTRHEADDHIYRVELESGRSVRVTGDHSVMTLAPDFSLNATRCNELTEDDVCLVPNSIPASDEECCERDKRLAHVLGWYIADGSMTANESGYYVSFSLNATETEKVESLRESLRYFVDHVSESEGDGDGIKLTVARKAFYQLLSKYVNPSRDAATKRVPESVFGMPREAIREYLRGYYAGDAGVTIHSQLASDTMYLWGLLDDDRLSCRNESLNEGECDFGTHIIEQRCQRYHVRTSTGNSPFDRVPRSFVDDALEPVLTAKRGGTGQRIESIGPKNFGKLAGSETVARLDALSLAENNTTTNEIGAEMGKAKRTAEAYLRNLRDRNLVEKTANGGKGTDAQWGLAHEGARTLTNYRRLTRLFDGGYSFARVKNVERERYDDEYVYDFTVPGSQTFVGGEGGVLCHNTEYIFALTGFPVGLKWQELVALGAVETPDAKLFLYETQEQKRADMPELLSDRPGKTLILCDSLDRGHELADDLDVPFVHGETTERMDVFQDPDNRVVIGSRVADEGVSLSDLDIVMEYDFHGGSRRQEAQRYGRVMHGQTTGEHLILMTDAEYEQDSKRLLSLEEQGVTIVPERRE